VEIVKDGSTTFYELLDEMADLHRKKSHDYASNDDPTGNYHFAGRVAGMFAYSPNDAGFAGRLAEKLYRLANLEKAKKTPLNESVEDTEKDIAVITVLWMADRKDRRLSKQWDTEDEATKQEKLVLQLLPVIDKMTKETLVETLDYMRRLLSDKTSDAVVVVNPHQTT
jgi:hypothetical protein